MLNKVSFAVRTFGHATKFFSSCENFWMGRKFYYQICTPSENWLPVHYLLTSQHKVYFAILTTQVSLIDYQNVSPPSLLSRYFNLFLSQLELCPPTNKAIAFTKMIIIIIKRIFPCSQNSIAKTVFLHNYIWGTAN